MKKRMILVGGNIYTLDKKTKADTMIIEDGIIKSIGRQEDIVTGDLSRAEKIDLKGKTILPGFTDAHNHMLTYGLLKKQLDYRKYNVNSINDVLYKLKEYVEINTSINWIRCCGFNDSKLNEKRLLNRFDIDKVVPHKPVIITRVCAHVSILNSKAIEELNLEDDVIASMKDEFEIKDGELTGVVSENAQTYVLSKIPAYTEEEIVEGIDLGQRDYYKSGICGIHDPGTDLTNLDSYLHGYIKSQDTGILKMRTNLMYRIEGDNIDKILDYYKSYNNKYHIDKSRLYLGGVKFFADGSIGGKTAAIYHGYKNDRDNKGILPEDKVRYNIARCHKAGVQVVIHAIGDRAIYSALDEISRSIDKYGQKNLRHRIEHCELCNDDIIGFLKNTKSIPVIQPAFIHHFGLNYRSMLGKELARNILPHRELRDVGLPTPMSTDCPVIPIDPLQNIYSSVTRKLENGEIHREDQCISVLDAIKGYTIDAAYASFSDKHLGTLSEGKYGDFVVLNEDILKVGKGEIKDIKVDATYIHGEPMYLR